MRRRTTPKFWLFMIVATFAVFAITLSAMEARYLQRAQKLREVSAWRDELILSVQDLRDQLEYVKTDEYVMRAARDRLSLIMPDEYRYVNGAK